MKKIIVLACFIVCCYGYNHGQKLITGQIFNDFKEPLPYASVFISNKPNTGTFTNGQGFFSLKADILDTLFISHVGYESTKIIVSDFRGTVFLKESMFQLKEITVSTRKKTRYTIQKLGTYWEKPDINWFLRGRDNYALLIPNNIKQEGFIKSLYFKIKHERDKKSKKYKNSKIQLRVRIYAGVDYKNGSQIDLLRENIIVIMKQSSTDINISLKKYKIRFPKEGVIIGIDIMGYIDKNNKLIEGSIEECRKNIYIRQTNKIERENSFYKNFNTTKWYPISKFIKPQTNEMIIMNVMFGAEVIFEEY
ncbi:MAG: hypothetical protein OHK0057_30220 [Thermoflexibacter sp.]